MLLQLLPFVLGGLSSIYRNVTSPWASRRLGNNCCLASFHFFLHPLNPHTIRKDTISLSLPHQFISVVRSVIAKVCGDAPTGTKIKIQTYVKHNYGTPLCMSSSVWKKTSTKTILVVVLTQIHSTSLRFLQSHLLLILHFLRAGISHVTFCNARSTNQMERGLMQPYVTTWLGIACFWLWETLLYP